MKANGEVARRNLRLGATSQWNDPNRRYRCDFCRTCIRCSFFHNAKAVSPNRYYPCVTSQGISDSRNRIRWGGASHRHGRCKRWCDQAKARLFRLLMVRALFLRRFEVRCLRRITRRSIEVRSNELMVIIAPNYINANIIIVRLSVFRASNVNRFQA